jgi:hypothetical protein
MTSNEIARLIFVVTSLTPPPRKQKTDALEPRQAAFWPATYTVVENDNRFTLAGLCANPGRLCLVVCGDKAKFAVILLRSRLARCYPS